MAKQVKVTDVSRTNNISGEFYNYVLYIEKSVSIPVRLTFENRKSLEDSAKYLIAKALAHPNLIRKFVDGVKRIGFITPVNDEGKKYDEKKMNFEMAIRHEILKQLDDLCVNLNSESDWTVDRAISYVKFYGEMYNVDYIYNRYLKKYLDIFKFNHSTISSRCFDALFETVKDSIPRLTMNESNDAAAKSLLEMLEEFKQTENSIKNEGNKQVFKFSGENFPVLKSSPLKIVPHDSIQSLINKLNEENAAEIQNKILVYKTQDENETWQFCYKLLIEKALSVPTLAKVIITICRNIPNHENSSWQKIQTEDYKNFINYLIMTKLENVFNDADASGKIQVYGILSLIENMMENSMCSIGFVAKFIDVLIKCFKKDENVAANILCEFMKIVKSKFSSEKIKKLPEEKRIVMMEILSNAELIENIECDLKESAKYLGIEFSANNKLKSHEPAKTTSTSGSFQSNQEFPSTSGTINSSFKLIDRRSVISETMEKLNSTDLHNYVAIINALKIETCEELKHFAELIIKNVQSAKVTVQKYAKLSFDYRFLKVASNDEIMVFKNQISESCETFLTSSLNPQFDKSREKETYLLVDFIAELYNLKVVDQSFIKICLGKLFAKEVSCFFCIHCIDIIMRKIGSNNDERDQEMLDKYFKFLENAVLPEHNAIPYRTNVYKELIKFRKSGWKNIPYTFNKRSITPPDLLSLSAVTSELSTMVLQNIVYLSLNDLVTATSTLTEKLTNPSVVKKFINSVIEFISLNNLKTHSYAILCKKLVESGDSNFKSSFKEILNNCIFNQFAIYVSKENSDKSAMIPFANILVMVAELYDQDLFSNANLYIWLQNDHVKNISIEHLTRISSIISRKILMNNEDNTLRVLKSLEQTIYDETLNFIHLITNDTKEIKSMITRNTEQENEHGVSKTWNGSW